MCESSSELAGNFDFIVSPLGVEGGLHDPVGEEWIKKEKWRQGVHAGGCISHSSAKEMGAGDCGYCHDSDLKKKKVNEFRTYFQIELRNYN